MNSSEKCSLIRSSLENTSQKRQELIEEIQNHIKDLSFIRDDSTFKEQYLQLYGVIQDYKSSLNQLENQLYSNMSKRFYFSNSMTSPHELLTPPRNFPYDNQEKVMQDIFEFDKRRSSTSFKIPQEKSIQQFFQHEQKHQVNDAYHHKQERNKFLNTTPMQYRDTYSRNNIYSSLQDQSQYEKIYPNSLEKSFKNIDSTTYDFNPNHLNKISSQQSDYFDQSNRYRNLYQQNLGQEFNKVKTPSWVNTSTYGMQNSLPHNKDFNERNKSSNYSIEDIQVYEEMNNETKELKDRETFSKFDQLHHEKLDTLIQSQVQINKQEHQSQSKDQQSDCFYNEFIQVSPQEFDKNDKVSMNINNLEIKLNTQQQIHPKKQLKYQTQKEGKKVKSPSVASFKSSKPQRKKKEKAKHSLKAFYEQNSEDSNSKIQLNQKKKIVKKVNIQKNKQQCTSTQNECENYFKIQLNPQLKKSVDAVEIYQESQSNEYLRFQQEGTFTYPKPHQGHQEKKEEVDVLSKQYLTYLEEEEHYEDDTSNEEEEGIDDSFDCEDSSFDSDRSSNSQTSKSEFQKTNQHRGPYKKYSVKLKKKLVNLKGEQPKELSLKYGIPMKNLQRWKVYGAERREGGGRKIMDLNMEVILLEYCIDYTLRGRCRCPRKLIMQKARDFTLETSKFKGSKGWLDKYSTRTGLSKIMTELKQLRVSSEGEIFKMVKLKSIEHIKNKIKQSNPLCIFTSQQYIRFIEEGAINYTNFWNIQLPHYKFISHQYQQYLTMKGSNASIKNYFVELVDNYRKNKDLSIFKTLQQQFGINTAYLLDCLCLQRQIKQSQQEDNDHDHHDDDYIFPKGYSSKVSNNQIENKEISNSCMIKNKQQNLENEIGNNNNINNNSNNQIKILKNITNIIPKVDSKSMIDKTKNVHHLPSSSKSKQIKNENYYFEGYSKYNKQNQQLQHNLKSHYIVNEQNDLQKVDQHFDNSIEHIFRMYDEDQLN